MNEISLNVLLNELLDNPEPAKREAAARALIGTNDERAIEPLFQALREREPKVGTLIAEALGGFGPGLVPRLIKIMQTVDKDKPSLEDLINDSGKEEGERRFLEYTNATPGNAARTLGFIKDERAIEPLIKAFNANLDGYLRISARFALRTIGEKAFFLLVEKLQDMSLVSIVRWEVVQTLGEMGDTRAVKPLQDSLNNSREYVHVKEKAIDALVKIQGPAAVGSLVEVLKDDSRQFARVVEYAAQVLGNFGPDAKAALDELDRIANQPRNPRLKANPQKAAKQAIKKITAVQKTKSK